LSLFITFEGTAGSGKTTQLHLLAGYLREQGYDVLATREPGGTAIGDRVRDILLDPQHPEMLPLTDLLLFSASRAQLVGQVIRPHLEKGGIVLCDRYGDSSLAYQGYGRGLDLALLRQITSVATGGLVPDLTFYLDLPVEQGLQRQLLLPAMQGIGDGGGRGFTGEPPDRLDVQRLEFHRRVRQGYLELVAAGPERWVVIEASRPADEVQSEIRAYVNFRLARQAQGEH